MSNQSSVEWLIEKIRESEIECYNYLEILNFMEHEGFFEQAKAMHKEEIMEAHYAPKYGCFREQYYNETFGE